MSARGISNSGKPTRSVSSQRRRNSQTRQKQVAKKAQKNADHAASGHAHASQGTAPPSKAATAGGELGPPGTSQSGTTCKKRQ